MLAALLPLALQAIQLWRNHTSIAAPGAPASTSSSVVDLAMKVVGLYRGTRDAALASGEVAPTDPLVVTDAQLIDAYETDAVHFRDHADALLKKYAPPTV